MLENDRIFGQKRLLGVLNGVLVHSVLSKNLGPGLLGVKSGLGVLTEGVISEFYCIQNQARLSAEIASLLVFTGATQRSI